jgi:hypothetical protein
VLDFNEYEWLAAVRTRRHSKHAWVAAHALTPWMVDGVAQVAVSVLRAESQFTEKFLRIGFTDLEAMGLLTRDPQRRKRGSVEYDVRTYRAVMPDGQ